MKRIKQGKWEKFQCKIFPVILMVIWAVLYCVSVYNSTEDATLDWKPFLTNIVLLGSLISKAAIENNKAKQWQRITLLLIVGFLVYMGVQAESIWILRGALYLNVIFFAGIEVIDMIRTGIIGSPSEKEDTDVQQCSVCENCPHMCERKAGIKTCSANAHTEQHVNKNIKNTFFNIIIQRPIQIANEKEENERISLQKSLAKEEETNE